MTLITAYLWGVASVFMIEGVVLVFAIDWLRKKVHESADKTTEMV